MLSSGEQTLGALYEPGGSSERCRGARSLKILAKELRVHKKAANPWHLSVHVASI